MRQKIVSHLTGAALLLSVLCLPARAFTDARAVTQIAARTYDGNLRKLNAVQQAQMQRALRNIEYKMTQDPEGHLTMAYMAMVAGGASPQAQAVLAAWGARKYPRSLSLVNNLGYALHVLKDYPSAEKIFREALAIDAESLETMINLANLYLDTDRDEEARRQYEGALEIDEEYYKAWEGLYGYHMKKKKYREAMEIVAKIKPAGFIQRGKDEMQREEDAESQAQKLDHLEEGDSLGVMEQKIARIAKTKPLNPAPIVAEVDPAMAEKIRDVMENLKVMVRAPDTPWPFDFSSARDYHITSSGYGGIPLISEEHKELDPDPEMMKKAEQIQALSDAEIQGMVDNYLEGVKSNYNNFLAHKTNFRKYFTKLCEEFAKESDGIEKRFESEMEAVREKQGKKAEEMSRQGQEIPDLLLRQWTKERNGVRDRYVQEFGNRLTVFYRSHVKPAIEKAEENQALYIKNMANKSLKNTQAEQWKDRSPCWKKSTRTPGSSPRWGWSSSPTRTPS